MSYYGQNGRPRRQRVQQMLRILDRLENIEEAEREVGYALQDLIQRNDNEPNDEIRGLLERLRGLNAQYARVSLRVIFAYAHLSSAQRMRVDFLRRDQIVQLRLRWVFRQITRLVEGSQ